MSERDWRHWERVGVIGAGNMGSGIAQKYATEGIAVVVVDLDDEVLERGRRRVQDSLAEAVSRKIKTPAEAESVLAHIQFTLDLEPLKEADLIIEAVFEDLEVKRDLFKKLGDLTGPGTVLATNTSSLNVKDLAAVTKHPERVIGLHYFYHPAKNHLVEVIPGPSTPDEIVDGIWDLQEAIGKAPIRCKDAPCFLVNRFFVPLVNEAGRILDEKIADIPTIEEAVKKTFKVDMGPFQLMNETGVPVEYAATSLQKELGDLYKPAACIKDHSGRGAKFEISGAPDPSSFDEVSNRLLGLTFHLASEAVSEGVGTVEDTDIGARVGLRWNQGPFQMMNRIGVGEAADLAERFQARYGLRMPTVLEQQRNKGEAFPLRFLHEERVEDLVFLTFYRPGVMNALNDEVLDQLEEAFDRAVDDELAKGIVLRGAGKAFVAGADVRFLLDALEAKDLGGIRKFTEKAHRILNKVDRAPKPVMVQLDGVTLGGGFCLALAADYIVATPEASIGFPETGLGLYPGLGGMQRTARRVGIGLARYLVLTGDTLDARTARQIRLVDALVDRKDLNRVFHQLIEIGPRGEEAWGVAPAMEDVLARHSEVWKDVAASFRTLDLETALAGKAAVGGDLFEKSVPIVEHGLRSLRGKAPMALRIADRLIREGAETSLVLGLKLELASLEEIFGTEDAHEGLKALVEKRRPEYKGR